nr:AraC family transcriptional regulator [Devosia geojensis]
MSYFPSMTWRTEGIQVTAPVKWRELDGMMGVFWQAESQPGASAYYLADDPRIMIFFNDVSGSVSISNQDGDFARNYRPMARAVYIPAGVPLWTNTGTRHRFSHLNLHLHKDRLLRYLALSIGRSAALTALRRPVEIQDLGAIETLAQLLVDELTEPTRHLLYTESLVGSVVTGLLDIPDPADDRANARLTQGQMNKLAAAVNARGHSRLTVAELAATVGLSESWFGTVFKQTTGKTPLQWILEKRIELAKHLLLEGELAIAEVAARLGFTDQAHLTKTFRQIVGETPAVWRRAQSPR